MLSPQDLKGRHERQRDRFGLLVAGLRAERHVDGALEEASGYGSSHTTSPSRVGSGGSTLGTSHSLAGRLLAARPGSGTCWVAIRYSQVRSEARSPNPPKPCQAASSVSWGASSASWRDPGIR